MNDIISKQIANELVNLPFIDRSGGCCIPYKKGNVSIPISNISIGVKTDCYISKLYSFEPNTKYLGISFFEDLGTTTFEPGEPYMSTLNLNVWINTEKIGFGQRGEMATVLLNAIPNDIIDAKLGKSILIDVQLLPKTHDPYSNYNLNENKLQYLLPPFEWFTLKIRYKVFNLLCLDLQEIIKC